ncbi:TPA: IS200/IS605 family transposase [Vibrio parahaemolyticus]
MSKSQLKSHPHCVFNLKAHLVLVVAYRRNVMTDEILKDMELDFRRICGYSSVDVIEFNGEGDHIHALIELHPNIMPSKLVNSIKTVTSRLVRKKHWDAIKGKLWGDRFWSRSYCLISVGDGATTEILKSYIQSQRRPN